MLHHFRCQDCAAPSYSARYCPDCAARRAERLAMITIPQPSVTKPSPQKALQAFNDDLWYSVGGTRN